MSSSALAITIDSEPSVLFAPDQAPDAEQEVVLDDDQVSVMDSSTNFSVSEVVRLRDGTPATGGFGVLPPPPPQDPTTEVTAIIIKSLLSMKFTPKTSSIARLTRVKVALIKSLSRYIPNPSLKRIRDKLITEVSLKPPHHQISYITSQQEGK